jgi:hypothetical protein
MVTCKWFTVNKFFCFFVFLFFFLFFFVFLIYKLKRPSIGIEIQSQTYKGRPNPPMTGLNQAINLNEQVMVF